MTNHVEITSKTFSGLLGAGYSIIDEPSGHLDIAGGVKIWSVDTTISFSGGLLDGFERQDSATWVDAVPGLRGAYYFSPNFYLTGWGLVGAGGANIDWDVAAGLGFKFDVVQRGPIIGVASHF